MQTRIMNKDKGHAEGDYAALDYENAIKCFTLRILIVGKFNELHQDIVVNGSILYIEPTFQEIQVYVEENLHLLWSEYKRTMNPKKYPVDLSEAC